METILEIINPLLLEAGDFKLDEFADMIVLVFRVRGFPFSLKKQDEKVKKSRNGPENAPLQFGRANILTAQLGSSH